MRHLAWLSAVPRDQKPRSLSDEQVKEERVSRMQRRKADGMEVPMPPLPAPHLLDYLMTVGPVEITGMDKVPVSWTTLESWQRCTGIELPPWQCKLLLRLSADFLAESKAAEEPDAPAPWMSPGSPENRQAVSAKLRGLFDHLRQTKRRRKSAPDANQGGGQG